MQFKINFTLSTEGTTPIFHLDSGNAFDLVIPMATVIAPSIRHLIPTIPISTYGPNTEVLFPPTNPSPMSLTICGDWMSHKSGLILFEQMKILSQDFYVSEKGETWFHGAKFKDMLNNLPAIQERSQKLIQLLMTEHIKG